MSYTPGPWTITNNHVVKFGGGVICTTASRSSAYTYEAAVGSLEDSANRRLISAAPDLLAACREVIPCLEDWIRTTGYGEINHRDKDALITILFAINKAEGRET